MSYVDKIKKGSDEYDVNDPRLPQPQVADAGKVLKVADDGGYELGEAGGGSEPVYQLVDITNDENASTVGDLATALGSSFSGYIELHYTSDVNGLQDVTRKGYLEFGFIGGPYSIRFTDTKINPIINGSMSNILLVRASGTKMATDKLQKLFEESYIGDGGGYEEQVITPFSIVPDKRALSSSKTYVLKCVNGTIQWVEEQA